MSPAVVIGPDGRWFDLTGWFDALLATMQLLVANRVSVAGNVLDLRDHRPFIVAAQIMDVVRAPPPGLPGAVNRSRIRGRCAGGGRCAGSSTRRRTYVSKAVSACQAAIGRWIGMLGVVLVGFHGDRRASPVESDMANVGGSGTVTVASTSRADGTVTPKYATGAQVHVSFVTSAIAVTT